MVENIFCVGNAESRKNIDLEKCYDFGIKKKGTCEFIPN